MGILMKFKRCGSTSQIPNVATELSLSTIQGQHLIPSHYSGRVGEAFSHAKTLTGKTLSGKGNLMSRIGSNRDKRLKKSPLYSHTIDLDLFLKLV